MLHLRSLLAILILAGLPLAAPAQAKKRLEHIVVYKDGFFIKGLIGEEVGEIIYDSSSGQSFPVASGKFFLTDFARTVHFGHHQIQKVLPLESSMSKPIVRFNWRDNQGTSSVNSSSRASPRGLKRANGR